MREIEVKWPRSEGYTIATWYLQERPIFRREAINKSSDGWRRTLPMIVEYGIRLIPIVDSPETISDGADKAWKNPRLRYDRAPIEPRSRRNRAAIVAQSSRNHSSFVGNSSLVDRQAIDEGTGPRSWPDRGPIVARSWPDRGRNCGDLEAKLKPWSSPIRRDIEATIHAHEIALRKPQPTLTTRSITHDFRSNFLFKTNVFLPFKLNF